MTELEHHKALKDAGKPDTEWEKYDACWDAISSDEQLKSVRGKLSLHETRLIISHAFKAASKPDSVQTAQSEPEPKGCICHRCIKERNLTIEFAPNLKVPLSTARMIVCSICGNKRCPHASDHDLACTGSNEPGQVGSVYAAQRPHVSQAIRAAGFESVGELLAAYKRLYSHLHSLAYGGEFSAWIQRFNPEMPFAAAKEWDAAYQFMENCNAAPQARCTTNHPNSAGEWRYSD